VHQVAPVVRGPHPVADQDAHQPGGSRIGFDLDARACRTACFISPSVFAFIGSKTSSWMRQPNSGRIRRSPGAVIRISCTEESRSATPLVRLIDPLWSTRIGQAKPRPMKSTTSRTVAVIGAGSSSGE
jgi:hypothetical protein